jgi:recombination protein RecA
MAKKELDLAGILAESLNKKSKDQQVAYFLDSDSVPTNVEGWVGSGSDMMDIAISNRPNGGFPVGRIIEITGLEQSGKSLLSAHSLANTQAKGGVAVLIDTETAVSREFMEAIGVDTSKLLYVSADSVEQIFEYIETIIEKVRANNKDKFVTIVVDSVAAASTEKELEADYGKDGYATDKAIIISKAMRKITNMIAREKITLIFTNQLRQKMNAMAFSDPWTTSGGKALAFHSSVRLRLKNVGTIKVKDKGGKDKIVGIKVRAQVIKNRMGPPLRAADFDIFFDRGIDNYGSWLAVLKDNLLVKQSGAWYTYIDDVSGEEIKFQSKDFIQILETRLDIREQMYGKICDATVLKYKKKGEIDDFNLDELSEDNEVID